MELKDPAVNTEGDENCQPFISKEDLLKLEPAISRDVLSAFEKNLKGRTVLQRVTLLVLTRSGKELLTPAETHTSEIHAEVMIQALDNVFENIQYLKDMLELAECAASRLYSVVAHLSEDPTCKKKRGADHE